MVTLLTSHPMCRKKEDAVGEPGSGAFPKRVDSFVPLSVLEGVRCDGLEQMTFIIEVLGGVAPRDCSVRSRPHFLRV
jgi:hypothetical protein